MDECKWVVRGKLDNTRHFLLLVVDSKTHEDDSLTRNIRIDGECRERGRKENLDSKT